MRRKNRELSSSDNRVSFREIVNKFVGWTTVGNAIQLGECAAVSVYSTDKRDLFFFFWMAAAADDMRYEIKHKQLCKKNPMVDDNNNLKKKNK